MHLRPLEPFDRRRLARFGQSSCDTNRANPMVMMHDCLIIGGGVVGLSLAYELARRGRRVRVVDRGLPGRESSWAGAGIFPPSTTRPDAPPLERLSAFSLQLHADWAARLLAETGIDNGYRRCGGLYLADTDPLVRELNAMTAKWRDDGIRVDELTPAAVGDIEPIFSPSVAKGRLRAAVSLPDEIQIRNSRHLRASPRRAKARRGNFGRRGSRRVRDRRRTDSIGPHSAWGTGGRPILHLLGRMVGVAVGPGRISARRETDSRPDRALEIARAKVATRGLCRAALSRAARRRADPRRFDARGRRLRPARLRRGRFANCSTSH